MSDFFLYLCAYGWHTHYPSSTAENILNLLYFEADFLARNLLAQLRHPSVVWSMTMSYEFLLWSKISRRTLSLPKETQDMKTHPRISILVEHLQWSLIIWTWCATSIHINNFWLVVSTPLKNISRLGLLFPIYGQIKNVPNHQPDLDMLPRVLHKNMVMFCLCFPWFPTWDVLPNSSRKLGQFVLFSCLALCTGLTGFPCHGLWSSPIQ